MPTQWPCPVRRRNRFRTGPGLAASSKKPGQLHYSERNALTYVYSLSSLNSMSSTLRAVAKEDPFHYFHTNIYVLCALEIQLNVSDKLRYIVNIYQ